MIDSKYRNIFQPFFDKIASKLALYNISPKTITLLSFVIGIICSILLAFKLNFLFIIILWISGLFDVLDGTLARMLNKQSLSGSYMDLIFDRLVECFVVIGFTISYPKFYIAYELFLIAVIFNFSTFLIAAKVFENTGIKSMHYDIGFAERTETFIIFTLLALFPQYIMYILMIFNIVIIVTGIIRFYKVMKKTKDLDI